MIAIKTDDKRNGLIKLDPRTLFVLILFCNITVFMMPDMIGECVLTLSLIVLALLCGVYRYSVKIIIIYTVLFLTDFLLMHFCGETWLMYVAVGCRFMRKVVPTAILGGILILTVKVNTLMAALQKMHLPKSVIIPFTVLLRYFLSIKEDRQAIKKSMAMRGLNGGFFRHPVLRTECLFVPLLLSASRRADELSCAAVTRGIENPEKRTSMSNTKLVISDYAITVIMVVVSSACIFGGKI